MLMLFLNHLVVMSIVLLCESVMLNVHFIVSLVYAGVDVIAMLLMFAVTPLVAQTVKVGDPAPEFSSTTLWGERFSLTEVSKDSIVVIFFMGYS